MTNKIVIGISGNAQYNFIGEVKVVTSTQKKILFAISDTGGGHRSAATAIIAALRADNGQTPQCQVSDILRATRVPGIRQAPEIYDFCSKYNLWLNDLFFRKTNNVKRISTLSKLVYMRARYGIEHELTAAAPDLVVAVHPLVIGLLAAARKSLQASWPIVTVVTDLATLHASWASPGADLYLVPTEEAYHVLQRHGVPRERLIFTGFPIHPKFAACPLTQAQARRELGLDADRFTVLITGGGVGTGRMFHWVRTLDRNCPDKQLLVVSGNNARLRRQLARRCHSRHLQIYGFVHNMETLMAASDVVVTKAGPGTVMEAMAMRRPVIITAAVGIQEIGNIDFVHKRGVGYHCPDPGEGPALINSLAQQRYTATYDAHVPIDGAARIARILLDQLEQSKQSDRPAAGDQPHAVEQRFTIGA